MSTTVSKIEDGFVADVIFYFGVKIVTSLDDLVWLGPFVALAATGAGTVPGTRRIQVGVLYTLISLCISLVALLMAWLTIHGLTVILQQQTATDDSTHHEHNNKNKRTGRLLNLIASVCIALLAWKEWKDNQNDDNDDNNDIKGIEENEDANDDRDEERANGVPNESTALLLDKTTTTTQSTTLRVPDESTTIQVYENNEPGSSTSHSVPCRHLLLDLLVVGVLGQLDTLAVFFSVLVSRTPIRIGAVIMGSLGAVVIILACAYFITLLKPLTTCLQAVPLWMILAVIALWMLLQAIVNI